MAQTNKIGVITATIIGMNAMIGAGIFTAPAAMGAYVGPAGILAYLFVVIAVWFLAQSLARLAELYPEEGSFYVYASKWGGHTIGLLASWAYFMGPIIAIGLLSQVAGFYLEPLFPSYSPHTLGLLTLLLIIVLNMCGIVMSEIGQQILIVCTTFPIIATTLICLSQAQLSNLTPFAPYGILNIFKATRAVIFGFFGFECATSLFAIVDNPKKNVPRAVTYAIILVGILYTLFIASLILSTPFELFSSPHVRITDILKVTFPHSPWLLYSIHLSILSAILGTIHSMLWSCSTLFIALVKKGKSNVSKKISHYCSSSWAVAFVGCCTLLTFSSIHNIDLFFSLTAIVIISAFLLSMITLLTLPSEWRSGQNIKTIIGMLTALSILFFASEGLVQEILKII